MKEEGSSKDECVAVCPLSYRIYMCVSCTFVKQYMFVCIERDAWKNELFFVCDQEEDLRVLVGCDDDDDDDDEERISGTSQISYVCVQHRRCAWSP